MTCFRCWDARQWARVINARRGPWKRHVHDHYWCEGLSLRDWILHLLVDNDVHGPFVVAGFLDAPSPGGEVFWRLDFWNARMAAEIRQIRDSRLYRPAPSRFQRLRRRTRRLLHAIARLTHIRA